MGNTLSIGAQFRRAVAGFTTLAGVLRAAVVVLSALTFFSTLVSAQTYPIQLNVGDILAAGVVPGSVVRINPQTGVQTLITNSTTPVSPNYITFATGVTIAPDGDVLVTDQTNGLIRINPITGAQSQVAHGGNPSAWFAVTGVRVGNNIRYYVADSGYSPDNGANYGGQILNVDLTTKAVTVVAQGIHACVGNPCLNGDEINHPFGLADDGNGNLIVSDMSSYGGQGAILRIEQPNTAVNPTIDLLWGPSANTPQWAAQIAGYPCPLGVTVQSSGDIIASRFVSNGYGCPPGLDTGLFRVGNPNPGDPYIAVSNFPGQTDFSVNGPGVAWQSPSGLDHDGNDDVIVADFLNNGIYELLKTGGSSFVYNNTCFQFAGTCGPPPSNIPFPVGVSVIRVNPPMGLKGGQPIQTTPTATCSAVTVTYNGKPHLPVCAATSNGLPVPGSWSYTYTPGGASAPVNIGSYSVAAAFTPTDTITYASVNANTSITINPAGDLNLSSGQTVTFSGGLLPGNVTLGGTLILNNSRVAGNVTLANGGSIVLNTSTVHGNLVVQNAGGTLTATGSAVGGDVQITGRTSFSLVSTSVGGNLQIQQIPAGSSQNQICGVQTKNDMQIQNNAVAIAIGSANGSCTGNAVGGNLQLGNNTASLSVFNNIVTGNLACGGNSSIAGAGNTAKSKSGQCSLF